VIEDLIVEIFENIILYIMCQVFTITPTNNLKVYLYNMFQPSTGPSSGTNEINYHIYHFNFQVLIGSNTDEYWQSKSKYNLYNLFLLLILPLASLKFEINQFIKLQRGKLILDFWFMSKNDSP
jgi:hypothetical protein